jgi:RNA polymerase sigma-70 factor (ECF subfamily)
MLKDEQSALDAMQDVFVALLRRSEQLEDRGLSALLWRIATNTCLNRLRSQKRKPMDPDLDRILQISESAGQFDRTEARSFLARAFGAEPAGTELIAVLHYHDGLTLQETAEVVGMSVSGVRRRLRQLRASAHAIQADDPRPSGPPSAGGSSAAGNSQNLASGGPS